MYKLKKNGTIEPAILLNLEKYYINKSIFYSLN